MPHYWFSHRANSHLNVPSQWSKADIIQPWPPFPAWHIEINVPLNKAAYSRALPLADGLIVVFFIFIFFSFYRFHRVYIQKLYIRTPASVTELLSFFFMQGTDWSLLTMLWCQVLSGWKLYNRHSKSKAALWERKGVGGWNKEQNSWVCHKRCKRFEVSTKTGELHFNVISSLKRVLCLSIYLQS